jgi:hypothetical protein
VFLEPPGSDANHSYDELRYNHTDCPPYKKASTANLVNGPERNRSADCINECGEDRDQERIVNRSKRGEEYISKVEDKVDTSELLHHLHHDTEN